MVYSINGLSGYGMCFLNTIESQNWLVIKQKY